MRRIALTFAGERFEAVLLEREAPRTCAALWARLPLDGELLHAHFIGPALTMTTELGEPGVENPYALSIPSGAILLDVRQQPVVFDGERLPQEFVIVYGGGARMLNWAGFSPANWFARVETGLDRLAMTGRRLHGAGTTALRVSALSP